jgi:hypothetical protein
MKLYVLTFEPYHENSTVMGLYNEFEKAMEALKHSSDDDKETEWCSSDTYELQEWDTETGEQTNSWVNYNPKVEVKTKGSYRYAKAGWRVGSRDDYLNGKV